MSRPADRRANGVRRVRDREMRLAWAAFLPVMLLSSYLVQRALTELARGIGQPWWRRVQFDSAGLNVWYVGLTVAWPLVLACLCWVCRCVIRSALSPASSATSGWAGRVAVRGGAVAVPASNWLWNATAAGPAAAVGLHLAVGLWNLVAVVGQDLPRGADGGTAWLTQWAAPLTLVFAGACAIGLLGARDFFSAMRTIRHALSAEPHVTGMPGWSRR